MTIDEMVEFAIYNKYYGALLTEKQRKNINMYVDNNLSLAEAGEELNISRQAVKDSIDKSFEALKEFENKLHFIARDIKIKEILNNKSLSEIDTNTKNQILSILEDN